MADDYTFSFRIAGNTQNPALIILSEKGYRLWVEEHVDRSLSWNADKGGRLFSATDPVELLGLVCLWELRGDSWQTRENEHDLCEALLNGT